MGIINWFKGKTCKAKKHYPVETYSGLCKIGYTCHYCGYKWYVPRQRNQEKNT